MNPPDKLCALALDLIRQGDLQGAEGLLRPLEPAGDPEARFLLGVIAHSRGECEPALAAFDAVLAADPRHLRACAARGAVLIQLGRHDEAAEAFARAVEGNPRNPQLHVNRSVALEALGHLDDALLACEAALALDPGFAPALMNRGGLLTRMGRLRDALENNDRLAALNPAVADAHFNRAEVLLALERWDDGLAACERALGLDPRHAGARIDRALALSVLGRLEEARGELDRVRRESPGALEAFRNVLADRDTALRELEPRLVYLDRLIDQQHRCDWRRRDELTRRFAELVAGGGDWGAGIRHRSLAFASLWLPVGDETRLQLAAGIAADVAPVAPQARRPGEAAQRLRIGYLSPDFRHHPTAFNTWPLFGCHDRSRFEVTGYALQPDDGSPIASRVRAGFDRFHEVAGQGPEQVARAIEADGVDILVDLGGYTLHCLPEALALRPAPVQVGFHTYPGTCGGPWLDYALVDAIVCPPGADRFWTEKLVRLPGGYFFTHALNRVEPSTPGRVELGLPAEGIVFCCFNNLCKIEPTVFDIWMRILRRVPGSVLWLLADDAQARENLRREAAARDVDPDRLRFALYWPHARHLARYRLADLFLDTRYYNAHTTAAEALAMGCPVLTCPGEGMPARVAASLLTNAGLADLVAGSPEAYEELAVRLALDPAALAAVRVRVGEARDASCLFDADRHVREIEQAFGMMWERYRAGLHPAAFAFGNL